jgi:hypothetical protein
MGQRFRKWLMAWLGISPIVTPEVTWGDIQVLRDRVDSLERIVMQSLQGSDEIPGTENNKRQKAVSML